MLLMLLEQRQAIGAAGPSTALCSRLPTCPAVPCARTPPPHRPPAPAAQTGNRAFMDDEESEEEEVVVARPPPPPAPAARTGKCWYY